VLARALFFGKVKTKSDLEPYLVTPW
jgi:hypothetical protein